MTLQSDCSIGIKAETTYGVAVPVDRFFEFTSEGFKYEPEFLQGEGMRVGSALPRSSRRSVGKIMVSGELEVEATTKGLGLLFAAAFGNTVTTVIPASTAYQQVHSMAATDPMPSYTIQKGLPPVGGGAVLPHTFSGMVCDELELSLGNGEILMVKTTWAGKDMATGPASGATAYQAPSYPAPQGQLFTFVHGTIFAGPTGLISTSATATALASAGATPAVADISDFTFTLSNAVDGGGYNMGGAGKRSRRPVYGNRSATGKITAEFDSAVLRDYFINQTRLSILLTFQTSTLAGTSSVPETIQLILPIVVLEGEIPTANGGEVIEQSIDFTCLDPGISIGANNQPTLVIVSTDINP